MSVPVPKALPEANMTHPIVCQNLHVSFGPVQALAGLTMAVPEGACFGFLGPNGAGKTTTLKVLTGQLAPQEGTASLWGHDPLNLPDEAKARLGLLPEEPALYPWMTPTMLLTFMGELFGMTPREARVRAGELVDQVGLADVAYRKIGGFSRGMRQRLGVAQALVNRPTLIFLDEPTSALDPLGRLEILRLIQGLRGQCTVFMSSHLLDDVERVCDEVAVLRQGRVLVQMSVDRLKERYATPSLRVEVEEGPQPLLDRLRPQPWAGELEVDGEGVMIRPHDMAQARRDLPALVVQAGLTLRSFRLGEPSLEDVFCRLVQGEGEAP